MKTTWTETMDAILMEMVGAAQPMRVIAARLGLNRNKVIGRSNRLGLHHPHGNNAGQRKPIERAGLPRLKSNGNGNGYQYLKSQKVNGNAVIPVAEPNGTEILFAERRRDQCAFIRGPVNFDETLCCGKPVHRRSWCESHYRELFTNPKGTYK